MTQPAIRLRPKANAPAVRHGFPSIYADALISDRLTRALPPPRFAWLEDDDRPPLALVAVTPLSKIVVRMIDHDPGVVIDTVWLRARLRPALSLRERLFDAPFYRLVHPEANGLPDIVIGRLARLP